MKLPAVVVVTSPDIRGICNGRAASELEHGTGDGARSRIDNAGPARPAN
jgi:hypothetical protein